MNGCHVRHKTHSVKWSNGGINPVPNVLCIHNNVEPRSQQNSIKSRVTGKNSPMAPRLEIPLIATSVDVTIFVIDVGDYDAMKRAVDKVGLIDVLLLNHSVFVTLVVVEVVVRL
ncbi:hypothetical protein PIB30_054238 [Stylosanthes scabra]|uniref:Uncharacterized protein n=1 Tax=Stylosanthes scabra TaxID=79078 RepID=A0ABU6XJX5_9FABA|nr:hypothetical protein [Stylosanthes scabra]